jgi:hypothetical protein
VKGGHTFTMTRSVAGLAVLVCRACMSGVAGAQDLSPRAYVITPVDSNALIATYAHQDGSVQFSGAVPITDADANVNLGILSFYHSFGVLGHAANFTIAAPYAFGDFHGLVQDVPRQADRSGSLDVVARVAVNLLGGPAMAPQQFATWHQDMLLGVSLTIVPPTGQYDPSHLVNYGSNRWSFKPELGYSQRFGNWVVDAYAGIWFFSDNADYFPGGNRQAEADVGAVEAHLSYDVAPRLWVSLDANYWWGGATSLNGVQNNLTNQGNSRVGITASVPLTAHQSLKFSFSDGAYIRYGGDYRSISLAWQYSWLGTRFR